MTFQSEKQYSVTDIKYRELMRQAGPTRVFCVASTMFTIF